jgi:hypothetical protein
MVKYPAEIAEIRARHAATEVYQQSLTDRVQTHKDRAWLLTEIEQLTRDRAALWAEIERLRGDAQAIAAIAHTGGTAGLSEHEALVEIRRRTLEAWDRKTSRAALEAKP